MSGLLFLFLLFNYINNFYVLPFDNILVKDETINSSDYHSYLTQNELYVNLSIGTPKQDFKAVLKMDKYGFIIYENALNFKLSTSLEEIDEDLKIGWGSSYDYIPFKDNFYLSSFDSYLDFNKYKNDKLYNIKKINKATFLKIMPKNGTSYYFNEMFKKYGIIGLKFNPNQYFNAPEFVLSLKAIKEIQSYSFSLKFDNNLKNGFSVNNNKGYFIVGEELNDDEEKKEEIKYANCEVFGGELSWDLKFEKIYTKVNNIENDLNEFKELNKIGEIIANNPYIIGTDEYFKYINKTFFNKLVEKNYCYCNHFKWHGLSHYNMYSYVCDSKSKDFMEYLNNNFPDLIFEHKEFEMNFTLTKNDLFAYNNFNNSDTNLYFLIMNCMEKLYDNWYIGIPFLTKYRLSFNYDTKKIGFYKNDGIIIDKKVKSIGNDGKNFFDSIIFKIILIVLLIFIIFILGMVFQKKFQKSRKKKANELDDSYEYESYKDQISNDNNIIND